MREEIYRNVAMPPTFLFAPQMASIANIALQMTAMFMTFAMFQVNFLWFVLSIFITHAVIASYSIKEPHIDKIMISFGKIPHNSTNMYSAKGVKLGS